MSNCVCVSEQQWGMFADCLGSLQRGELLGGFFFFLPLSSGSRREIVCLSVWTVSLKDERHYHERMQGVHAPVLTATWQTVLSGALRGSTFETCSLFFLERLLSKPDLRLEFST